MLARVQVSGPSYQETRLIRGLSENGIEALPLSVAGMLLLKFECLKHRMICWEPITYTVVLTATPGMLSGIQYAFTIEQALQVLNKRHNVGTPRI